jgi:hypothetical protein
MRLASSFLAVTVGFALWLGPALPPALALSRPVEPMAAPQAKSDKGVCEDTRYGFRFKAPKEWTRIPLKLEEQWQVAKYLSDKPYFYTDPTDGWTNEHKPQATVIAFVTEKVREEAKIRKQKDEKGDDRYVILISNPYKDYLDYMKRTYSGGGWFVSDEKEAKLEDLPVTQYEIKVEKLTRDGPKRIICWVYHTPEVDFAFHWEVLESAYPKLKDTVYDTLKSFKLIARTGSGLPTADTGERKIQLDDYDKQTPEQRKERRITLEQSLHAKAKTSVPDGWQALQVGRFLVLNHTDEKYARRVAEHCGVIFDWLDEAFPFVGPTEYVRAPILRICKDRDEENSFHSGGDFWFSDNQIEIVISQDNSGFVTGWAVERINRQLLTLWFSERDRDLSRAMPYWLREGLGQVIGTARAKGKKVEFRTDDWERDGIRELLREGNATPIQTLIRMGIEDFFGKAMSTWGGPAKEAGGLVRFFVTGPASKNPKTRDILRDYLKNLKSTVNELKAADEAAGKKPDGAPKTEKEEEEQYKADAQRWKQREKQLLDTTFEKTFRSWTEKDWEAFQATYLKAVL